MRNYLEKRIPRRIFTYNKNETQHEKQRHIRSIRWYCWISYIRCIIICLILDSPLKIFGDPRSPSYIYGTKMIKMILYKDLIKMAHKLGLHTRGLTYSQILKAVKNKQ
jgi:hypothetical protein